MEIYLVNLLPPSVPNSPIGTFVKGTTATAQGTTAIAVSDVGYFEAFFIIWKLFTRYVNVKCSNTELPDLP